MFASTNYVPLRWTLRAIGPRVARLLLAQTIALTIFSGLALHVVQGMIESLRESPEPRAITYAVLALTLFFSSRPLRHALCPPSLALLRRQPVADASISWPRLLGALLIAWPSAAVVWLGHPDKVLVILAVWIAAAIATLGVISAASRRARLMWAALALGVPVLVDAFPTLVWLVLPALAFLAHWPLARRVRAAAAWQAPNAAGTSHRVRTPFGALLALDVTVLLKSLHWLSASLLPLAGLCYVVITSLNGNCEGSCLNAAGVVVTTLGIGLVIEIFDALRLTQGLRLLVPNRIVDTRLRLASLVVTTGAPLIFIATLLSIIAKNPLPLLHAFTVVLAVMWVQLGNPKRRASIGLVLCLLLLPTGIPWLPEAIQLLASVAVLIVLIVLVDRRGAKTRSALSAGLYWSSDR